MQFQQLNTSCFTMLCDGSRPGWHAGMSECEPAAAEHVLTVGKYCSVEVRALMSYCGKRHRSTV